MVNREWSRLTGLSMTVSGEKKIFILSVGRGSRLAMTFGIRRFGINYFHGQGQLYIFVQRSLFKSVWFVGHLSRFLGLCSLFGISTPNALAAHSFPLGEGAPVQCCRLAAWW